VAGSRAFEGGIADGSRASNPIANASLAFTVAEWTQLPPATGLELAFAGRSNAGKSSAINALARRRGLAFVARRPGKTQTIQFYRVVDDRYLVDLPGYGYARVSAAVQAQWGRLLESYLRKRSSLVGLMLIMDIRHPLTPLDQRLLDWIGPRDLPVHILLNKADKLTRARANATLAAVERQLQSIACKCSVQIFSSVRPEGVGKAVEVIRRWLRLDPQDQREDRQNKNPRLKGSKAGGEMP
jgi:GTP-binding protein